MNKSFWGEFFKIREPVSVYHKVILGITPIITIIVVWYCLTLGTTVTILLPDGDFDDIDSPIPVGTTIPDGTYLRISGWEFIAEEMDYSGTQQCHLKLTDGEFKLPIDSLHATKTPDNRIRIKIPRGRIIGRQNLPQSISGSEPESSPNIEMGTPQLQEKPKVTRGGLLVSEQPRLDKLPELINYRFEDISTRRFSPTTLPSPLEVIRSLHGLVFTRDLFANIFKSLKRVTLGFSFAVCIAFPLAVLMGSFGKFHALFSPLMVFGGYLPIPALVPLTLSFFGTEELQKIMFLALAFAIYLLPLFVKAVSEVDNVFLLTAYTLGASKEQIIRHVLVAISGPNVFDAMRMGFGVGWGYIMLAEMVDMGAKGVGAMILTSQRIGPREDIYLVLIAIVTLAFITDKLWELTGYWLFPYRKFTR